MDKMVLNILDTRNSETLNIGCRNISKKKHEKRKIHKKQVECGFYFLLIPSFIGYVYLQAR